ncbi:Uncharacterized protein Rs2_04929 [Raphanus sativus]|nr:Uncharacterized protein Rs2_04929 [Raphanus sativus]
MAYPSLPIISRPSYECNSLRESGFWRLTSRPMMSVVKGTISNFNQWRKFFFFVPLDAASVEEEFILMFRTVPNPTPYVRVAHPWPRDIMQVRDIHRSGDHWWTFFTRKRVHMAIGLVHCDFEAEGDVDFAPVERLPERVPVERPSGLSSKDKGIDLEDHDFPVDDFQLLGWDPNLGFGDGSGSSDMPISSFDDFFDGLPDNPNPPPFAEETERPDIVAETSRVVNGVSPSFFPNFFANLFECIFVFFFVKIQIRFSNFVGDEQSRFGIGGEPKRNEDLAFQSREKSEGLCTTPGGDPGAGFEGGR